MYETALSFRLHYKREVTGLAGFIVVLLIAELVLMMIGLSSNIEIDAAGEGADTDIALDSGADLATATAEGGILSPAELALLELPLQRERLINGFGCAKMAA